MRPDLAARYFEQRLPRYTSYPAAPHFSPVVGGTLYAEWLAALPAGLGISLYLHVPFCRSMCWYCGCHTRVVRRDEPIATYLTALRREIELVAEHIQHPRDVRHIHFGGGTPTILPPRALQSLIALLRARFLLAANAELAIEIDPRTLEPAMVEAIGASGFTRASIGVQSLDARVQRAVNRIQSFEETAAAVEALRRAGIRGIGLDLIYGLPHQTVRSAVETARACLTLRPDRFSVFGYAHVPAFKKHQRQIDESALACGAARQAQAEAIADVLTAAGYRPIGIDHYALAGDTMAEMAAAGTLRRNFQGYTTDTSPALIGFGASAIGRLPQGYVQNEVPIERYAAAVLGGMLATARGHALSPDDRVRADLIERLMCDLHVDVEAVCRAHGADPLAYLAANPRLDTLIAEGIARREGFVVSVCDDARPLARVVAAAFDAYIDWPGRTFSRVL